MRQINLGKKYDKSKATKASYREKIDKLQKQVYEVQVNIINEKKKMQ